MYIIIYDFGTSSVKTCLFDIDEKISIVASSSAAYGLYVTEDGGAEQDAGEWWDALCRTTHEAINKSGITPDKVEGMAFCCQMQSTILVDQNGNALRRPMSFLDQKGFKEYEEGMCRGPLKVSGWNMFKLIRNLSINYAASLSAKDPVWKYKWVENNEPEVFSKVYKWLDVCDYLVLRCTGRFIRTADSAYATFLYDTRRGKEGWNDGLIKMYKVNPSHMAEIIDSTDMAGRLTQEAASDLGLIEGIPVFGGGGDVTFVNIGAGCTRPGDTHIYIGTSGWVSTFLDHQTVDIISMIGTPLSVKPGYFNYYGELGTAGKCFEWVINHLALDEVGVYLEKKKVTEDAESKFSSMFEYLAGVISDVPAGANGVIFTPWLHGNRSPFEDSNAAGMFFNIKLENGKADMMRAVIEGVCYHLRWILECSQKREKTSDTIRFVGGGALSSVNCQILADITGHRIETVEHVQTTAAVGAALTVAAGVRGEDVLELAPKIVKADKTYIPNPDTREVYERNYMVFRKLYKMNRSNFRKLNAVR